MSHHPLFLEVSASGMAQQIQISALHRSSTEVVERLVGEHVAHFGVQFVGESARSEVRVEAGWWKLSVKSTKAIQ